MRGIEKKIGVRLVRGTVAMLSVLLLFFLSCAKWNIISASLKSLTLTPWVLIAGHADKARYLRSDLIEYWIAALAWILILLLLLRLIIRTLFKKRELTVPGKKGSYLVHCFLFIALLAPYLAPFDPTSQGDLRVTRLLQPFDKAVINQSTSSTQESNQLSITSSSPRRVLEMANTLLLRRQESFTRWMEPEGVQAGGDQLLVRPFLFGTDDLGRDTFSRLIYGVRVSFLCGLAAMLCAVLAGSAIGFSAGIAGGWIDTILMRLTDLFLSIPSLFLVIALVAFLGNSLILLIVLLAATGWMSVARIVRGEVQKLREREFVLAARLLGRSSFQIVCDHMIPNVLPIIVAASVMQLGNVILAEAALSFLGLGIQPPIPSLGNMIGESFNYIDRAWWMGVFPGVALSGIVISVNILASSLEQKARPVS